MANRDRALSTDVLSLRGLDTCAIDVFLLTSALFVYFLPTGTLLVCQSAVTLHFTEQPRPHVFGNGTFRGIPRPVKRYERLSCGIRALLDACLHLSGSSSAGAQAD